MGHILDARIAVKSAYVRKALVYALILKTIHRRILPNAGVNSETLGPIFVNSIPKSGTHLLLQVARSLPGASYNGRLVASMPSLTLRERNSKTIVRKLARSIPCEVVGGHVHYSKEVALKLGEMNASSFIIVRDLFDVFESEIHYIREMAKHHRMHGEYRGARSDKDCVEISFYGSRTCPNYPGFLSRIERYAGWIQDESIKKIKYEELTGDCSERVWRDVYKHFSRGCEMSCDEADYIATCRAAVAPQRSHTFTTRAQGRYLSYLTEEQRSLISSLNKKLGYA